MATYTWSIPSGNSITSSTKIKDTDNYLANTVDDLVDFVNGEGSHAGAGLTYDLVDKGNSQTISGQKTFSSAILANGGVTGNLTGNASGSAGSCTGNSATATKLATARTITISGGVAGSASFDGSADISISTTSAFPSGGIIIWSGSSSAIPSGWYLCNGSNGTPDLRNRFVVGATSTYAVGATGGSTDATLPAHSHTYSGTVSTTSLVGEAYTCGGNSALSSSGIMSNTSTSSRPGGDYASGYQQKTSIDATHNHTFSGTSSITGSAATNANLPPYYALCYIMKA